MGYLGNNNAAAANRIGMKGKVLDEFSIGQQQDEDLISASPGTLRRRIHFLLLRKLHKFNEPGSAVKYGKRGSKHADGAPKACRTPPDSSTVPVSLARAQQVSKQLVGATETYKFTAGSLVFGLLLFLCGAAPWMLPGAFLLFFFISIPHRIWSFHARKWDFFMADFCYWANVVTAAHLLWFPAHRGLEVAVYALTDGPLAGALVVWQCAWVFGSADHAVSVLIHLLPGLVMHAQRRYVTPQGWRQWLAAAQGARAATAGGPAYGTLRDAGGVAGSAAARLTWLFGAPLLFYCTWQLCYFIVVQVACRRFILRNDYDTSYNALARRAAKTNNIWNRLVRRGSIAHRCVMYGLLQLAFTLACLLLFLALYHYPRLGSVWQVVKFVVSVYYGAVYQCQKVPQHAFMAGMKLLQEEGGTQPTAVAAAGGKAPGPGVARRSRKSST